MAGIDFWRLQAIGPASALAGVEDSSVTVNDGLNLIQIRGQDLDMQHVVTRTSVPELTYTDMVTMYPPTFDAVSAFGLHFVQADAAGGDTATVVSMVADAFRVPQSVTASTTGAASTTVRVLFKSTFTKGIVSKTLGTATDTYILGPSTLNGAAIGGLESQTLTFGLDVKTNAGQGGSLVATTMLILRRNPVLTYTTTDLDLVTDYIDGVVLSSAAAVCKFAKRSAVSTGYSYTLAKAFVRGQIGSGDNPVTGTITVTPYGGEAFAGASY